MRILKGVDGKPLYNTDPSITVPGLDSSGNSVQITFRRIVGLAEIPESLFYQAIDEGTFFAEKGAITAGIMFPSSVRYEKNGMWSLLPMCEGRRYDALVSIAVIQVI